MCSFLEVIGYTLRLFFCFGLTFFFFNPYSKHLLCCQTLRKGKKQGLPAKAPQRPRPENSRTHTWSEKSKLNNGFTRAPPRVTLNQSKGKFTKIKVVNGSLLGKRSLTRQSQALRIRSVRKNPPGTGTRALILTGS